MQRTLPTLLSMALTLAPMAAVAATGTPATAAATATDARVFPIPDEAAKALLEAARGGEAGRFAALFGKAGAELLSSGDGIEDKNNREAFLALANQKQRVETLGEDRAILYFGGTDWPFPIPLAKSAEGWRFDAEAGRQEVLNRRIGRDELAVLSVIGGYVEAQFEYANADHDGDDVAEYAQKIMSEPGKADGLFWETAADEPPSPLGPLVAQARAEGYAANKPDAGQATPYHGYYYRVLTRQDAAAPGGKYDYIINGNMIGGFGLVAFPARYGDTGVMTFVVNHQGRIYQKDLGPKTAELARSIKEYNPDSGWEPVETQE